MRNEKYTPYAAVVMVVDDDNDILEYLSAILSGIGYKVLACATGQSALKLAQADPPDLILLDINMPGMNGYEVCVQLKGHAILKNIPVIFLSAFVDISEKIKAFECGGVDYITKPFAAEEVAARIEIHLDLARVRSLKSEIARRKNIERRYYAQLENLSDAIIHVNQTGTIVYCNAAVKTLLGYKPDELVGQPVEMLIAESYRQQHIQLRNIYDRAPFVGLMSSAEGGVQARKKNGQRLTVAINLSTLYSEDGLLVSAEIRDIGAQLELKKELEQQRMLLDDAFSKTTDGLILTSDEGVILMTNPAITKMSGYTSGELFGKDPLYFFDGDTERGKVASLAGETAGNTTNKPCTVNCRRKDKGVFHAEVVVVPIREVDSASRRCIYIIRDITDRIQLEQDYKSLTRQLVQAQKMEALGQLTGGIAHDFNNILASMMGFSELAIELIEEEVSIDNAEIKEKFSDYLHEIHTSGLRAQSLVRQMLTFSRSGPNGTLVPLQISDLINEAIKMLRPVLPASINIHAYIDEDTPRILADPVQVHQIVMNVCINARDAMHGRGRIDIMLRQTSLDAVICTSCQKQVAGEYLELSIQDTGPGIDTRLKERLFEPFFTTKAVGKGTGMGLAMAHGIIHHHSGHILVESDVGQGATFRLFFPLVHDWEEAESELQPEPQAEPA